MISIKIIFGIIKSFDLIENDIIDLAVLLNSKEEISDKLSCINVIALIYPNLTKEHNKSQCYPLLTEFTHSQYQMIKIELSLSLKLFASSLTLQQIDGFISSFLEEKNDQIRIYIMDALVSIKNNTTNQSSLSAYNDLFYKVITKLSSDESWRVRLTVADKISDLLSLSSIDDKVQNALINSFAKLIVDNEEEVRNLCCTKLELIAEILNKSDKINKILSQLKQIEKDKTQFVRASLASNLLRICPLIGQEKTNEYIFPIFLNMIKDESHDIRMALIKTLVQLHEVVNIDSFVNGIIPSLIEISNNPNWRIRNQISETIPVLARILNKKIFMDSILSICTKWLTDPVYAIRESACKLMKKLYDMFKGEEFEKKLLDKLNEMKSSDSYLIRNTVTILVKEFVGDVYNYDFIERRLVPYIIKMSKDKSGNIRRNCAAILKKISKASKSKEIVKEVNGVLEELKRDRDTEVIYAINDN